MANFDEMNSPMTNSKASTQEVQNNKMKDCHKNLNKNDVSNQARLLLTNFVKDRMDEDQMPGKEKIDELIEPGTPIGPPIDHSLEVQIGKAFKSIGDELDKDARMHNLMAKVPPRAEYKTFLKIAGEIFNDGVINWGRIVALFYFAYKMIIKSINHIPLIRATMNFVVDYIRDHVASWIIGRGGWEAIVEHFGTPTKQAAIVLGAGILLSVAIYFSKPAP